MDSIKGIKIEDLLPILDSISTPIFIDDANGNTLLANKASEILYDFDRDEIIGENVCLLEKEGIFSSSVAKLVIENHPANGGAGLFRAQFMRAAKRFSGTVDTRGTGDIPK